MSKLKRPGSFLAVVFLGSALLTHCGGSAELQIPDLEDLNVVLIVVDTLRADSLGAYNPAIQHTPHMDRLANDGVLFEQAYSPAPWTQPSVASLFTGLMPSTHNVRVLHDVLAEENMTLAEVFRGRGFKTQGIVSNSLLSESLGYDQGFEDYQVIGRPGSPGHLEVTGHQVTEQALRWLAGRRREKYFLLLHYFDPHYAYQHHEKFSLSDSYQGKLKPGMAIEDLRAMSSDLDRNDIDYLKDLYAEEVAFTDHQIGRVLKFFDAEERAKNTLIILTADHGEEFLTHGWLGHTRSLHDNLIRVPLILWLPGTLPPRRIEGPVSLVDVLPTLLSFSRLPMPNIQFDGISLKDAISSGHPVAREDLIAEVSFFPAAGGNEDKRALFTSLVRRQLKVIHDLQSDTWQAFDVLQDPTELNNLWGNGRAWEEMQLQLLQWETKNVPGWGIDIQEGPKIDADALRRLRSLGYVQ